MYLVIKRFIDKDNNKEYSIDSIYRNDDKKRIQRLRELGYLGEELIVKEVPEVESAEILDEIKEEVSKKSSKKK